MLPTRWAAQTVIGQPASKLVAFQFCFESEDVHRPRARGFLNSFQAHAERSGHVEPQPGAIEIHAALEVQQIGQLVERGKRPP
jgi:hypothetical protein